MSKPNILVTGANGQVGKELQVLALSNTGLQFNFVGKDDMPLHQFELVRNVFKAYKPAYCINCAAYTAVDKAESEQEFAFLVNAESVGALAATCREFGTKLIHISTDYVFNGISPVPYREDESTDPVNVYGASKRLGEELCFQNDPEAIIIRTAWVYSAYGHNFVKTMLRLMREKPSINVVNDQVGAPTYAADLARVMTKIIEDGKWNPGIYHYSNRGKISWYDFAMAIREMTGSSCQVNPILSEQYPTPARRPSFSLLNTEKIERTYHINIPDWKESLWECLQCIETNAALEG